MSDTSRNPENLHPPLKERWEYLRKEWRRRNPMKPQPFLIATYRGPDDQEKAVEEGKSNAHFGQSLHNYHPAYAFDIAFLDEETGKVSWRWGLYEEAADLLKRTGLEWGGDWPELRDGVHFQMPMTWEMAQQGDVPRMPPIQGEAPPADPVKLTVLIDREVQSVYELPLGFEVVVRYSPDRRRIYIDARKEG